MLSELFQILGINCIWGQIFINLITDFLNFFPRFLLKDGHLWLFAPQAKQIWKCLAENAVYVCDREACFKWYSKLMGDEPDLDPDINKEFFENNVLQLDPFLLTENGMKCFERFFKAVNCREGKLVTKRRACMMDDLELIGLDYLWRVSKELGTPVYEHCTWGGSYKM